MERIIRTKWMYGLVVLLLLLTIIFMIGKVSFFFVEMLAIVKKVLTPFFFSLIIAYLLNPIVTFLNRHHFPRGFAVFILYILFLLFIAFVVKNGGPVIIEEYRELSGKVPELMETYRGWLNRMRMQQVGTPFSLHSGLTNGVRTMEVALTGYITGLFSGMNGIMEKALIVMIIPFIVFYMLKDMKPMQQGILLLVPGRHRMKVKHVLHDIDTALGQYVRGQLTVCGIVGLLAYAGYFIIGLPYALVFAIISAVTNVIPYIGPFIGAAPTILFALTISWKLAVYVIIINAIIQLLEGNVVSPFIVGKSLRLHPLLIIFSVMVGGEVAGILGLILAVPLVASIKVILQHIVAHIVRRPDWPE
jgi:predicted PurR-regulated permease PerM